MNGREDIAELARVNSDLALNHAVQVIARGQGELVAKRAAAVLHLIYWNQTSIEKRETPH